MVDLTKIDAVRDWPRPRSASEIRRFLGLAEHYRQFIEGFSRIATPLIELTHKNLEFVWTDTCENIFQELKRRLVTVPVLSLPLDQEKFVVYCNASRQGLGCILMQTGKVIGYAS
ncbi:uncharacterized mitochondrial protein AtMg00860-like [Humulus lupulus]|uniref:uncharacterized mitochondrial protein AtMg00860-like n=1 Tax=Humulus lupulus TaxID=3486 RepID=UPI002B40D297|nr:uncharacterized mitochondrial protein AtMg00860-like [Humulus lupulus]